MEKERTVVILAAGMGTRLGNLTKKTPKVLQLVAGRPILHYTLAWAEKALKAEKIIVVGGYLFEQVREAASAYNPNVIVLENSEYETTQRMSSLLCAAPYIIGDLISLDGDYIYTEPIGESVRSKDYTSLAVHSSIVRSPYTEQDVICTYDDARHLTNIYKTEGTVPLTNGNQEWFNSLLYCPKENLGDFFEVARKIIKQSESGKVHVEDAVLAYSQIHTVDLVNLGEPLWMEIDNPEELDQAELFVAAYKDLLAR